MIANLWKRGRPKWLISFCVDFKAGNYFLLLLLLLPMITGALVRAEALSLKEAIDMGLIHNFSVKASEYDSVAAVEEFYQAQAGRYPRLSLESRTIYNSNVVQFQLDLPLNQQLNKEVGLKENYQTDVMLTMPLFTGGKLSQNIAASRSLATASSYGLEAQRMAVAYRTRVAYLSLLLAEAGEKIAESSMRRLEIINEDVGHLYKSGLADSLAILEAEQALESSHRSLIESQSAKDKALNTLKNILGIEDNRAVEIEDTLEKPSLFQNQKSFENSPGRPELARFDMLANAADHRTHLAKGEYFPTISALAGYSIGKPNRDMFGKGWDDYFLVGMKLNWSFDLGRGNAVEAARARAEGARMQRLQLEDELKLAYRQAQTRLDKTIEVIESTNRELDLARRKYKLAAEKQRVGELPVNRLLEMETELKMVEEATKIALTNYYLAKTDLYYSLGDKEIFGDMP